MSKVNILRDIRDYLIENSNFAVDYDDIAEIDSWVEVLNVLIGQTEWFEENLKKINDSMDELIDIEKDNTISVPKHLLDEAWEEAYEIQASFEDLNDKDVIICRDTLKGRAENIMSYLHVYAQSTEEKDNS